MLVKLSIPRGSAVTVDRRKEMLVVVWWLGIDIVALQRALVSGHVISSHGVAYLV